MIQYKGVFIYFMKLSPERKAEFIERIKHLLEQEETLQNGFSNLPNEEDFIKSLSSKS